MTYMALPKIRRKQAPRTRPPAPGDLMGQSPGKQQKVAAQPEAEGKDDAPAMIEVQLRLEMDQKNATEPARSECLKIDFKVRRG